MELKYNAEEIENYNFFQAWQTDDPVWVKNRKKQWPAIRDKLQQFIHFQKKNHKYIRNYFLTGNAEQWTETEIAEWKFNRQPYSIGRHFSNIGPLVTFWLSPDHSQDNWERIKCANSYSLSERVGKEAPVDFQWYQGACLGFRKMSEYYNRIDMYQKDTKRVTWGYRLTPFHDCESIFGEELDLFFLKELKVKINKETGQPYYGYSHFQYGEICSYLIRYLKGGDFNPHNPIKYFATEYVKWGLPFVSNESQAQGIDDMVGFAWYVVDTPKDRHPIQLQVATELKQEILVIKDSLADLPLAAVEEGIKMFEAGFEESYRKKHAGYEKGPEFKFRKKHFGHILRPQHNPSISRYFDIISYAKIIHDTNRPFYLSFHVKSSYIT